jgi:hypothetical protein
MRFMLLCYDDEQAWQKVGKAAMQEAVQQTKLTMGSHRCENKP